MPRQKEQLLVKTNRNFLYSSFSSGPRERYLFQLQTKTDRILTPVAVQGRSIQVAGQDRKLSISVAGQDRGKLSIVVACQDKEKVIYSSYWSRQTVSYVWQ
jgi:hypothetical protein